MKEMDNNKKREDNMDRSLQLPEDLLAPKGDALLIELSKHIKNGGKVKVRIEGGEDKTVASEDELFKITAPYTNQ